MAVDHTKFRKPGEAKKESDGPITRKWWTISDPVEKAQNITRIVNFLSENDSKRQTQYQMSARLYGNITMMGVNGLSFAKINSTQSSVKDRVTYNVVQMACDTVQAKMIKNKPRPTFLTSGGDYKLQRKAKKLDKFADGIFYEQEAHKLMPLCLMHAEVLGDGLIHVFREHGRIKWEPALASEMFVDPVEAFYGKPRQLHRVKNIDREVLLDLFPKKKDAITNVEGAKIDITGQYQNVSDQVTVSESWHLPSGPDAKDGAHVITIGSDTLFEEEWKRPYFPFAKLTWTPRLYGYWGQGIPEQIQATQLEINKICWVIQRSLHLGGTFKVWVKNGSKIIKEHINNNLGTIINSDEMPRYLLPPVVQPELYERLKELKGEALEQIGVSQLSAASEKPAGLNSGKALREFNDIESDRFQSIGQAYEDLALQLTRLSIDEAKEIAEEEGSFEVKTPGKKFIETIDWKDIDLENDEYIMKMFPVSSLPKEPAARLQTVTEFTQAGWYNQRQAKRLMDFPDLEQIDSLGDAQEDWLHETLEKIVDDGVYTAPDPGMDIQLAKELVLQYYAQGQTQGLEPKKLDMLRQFNTQLDVLTQKAMPPLPPMAAQPTAQPMPTPQSDLIPNGAGQGAA